MSMPAFTMGTGRRKTAVARVRLTKGEGTIVVNGRTLTEHFGNAVDESEVRLPFRATGTEGRYTAMIKIARNAGAILERSGGETDMHLRLPPATLDSRMNELVEEQLAQTDYRLKVQAKSFWDFLTGVREVRQGVREARHKSAG